MNSDFGVSLGMLAVLVIIYFVPTFISSIRNHPNAVAITLLNLFLGWTLIGWVVALVWSVLAKKPSST
ncbi:superinfection immunity protein [Stutzerimonas xanthomarina]|uniref:superinfection immunity protein n=1 Tax=Stutzerimonas xanthomarina TaxID=271420 RepID=UPI003AA7C998